MMEAETFEDWKRRVIWNDEPTTAERRWWAAFKFFCAVTACSFFGEIMAAVWYPDHFRYAHAFVLFSAAASLLAGRTTLLLERMREIRRGRRFREEMGKNFPGSPK